MFSGYKTIIGAVIAAIPSIATLFGFETSPDFTGQATEIAGAIVTLLGTVLAIYGRVVAVAPGWFAKKA